MMLNIFSYASLLCISSVVKCLFKFFAPILMGLFVFLLTLVSSSYTLDTSHLFSVWIADICCWSVVYLFILLTRAFADLKYLIFLKSNLSVFFFNGLCLWCQVQELCWILGPKDFLLISSKSFLKALYLAYIGLWSIFT